MLKRWFNREAAVADHEIVPGVDKPTLILVTMVVAKMLKEPKETRKLYETKTQEIYKYGTASTSDVSASFIEHRQTKKVGYEEVTTGYITSRHVVKCGKDEFELTDAKECKILEEGFKKALALKVKFEAQEAENARQDAALAAIDKFFKVKPEPEKPVSHGPGCNSHQDYPCDCTGIAPEVAARLTPCPPYATKHTCMKMHPGSKARATPDGWYPEETLS